MAKENEKVVIHHTGFLNNIVLDNNLTITNEIRFLEQTIQEAVKFPFFNQINVTEKHQEFFFLLSCI